MKLIIISLVLPIFVYGCSIFDPLNYDKQIGVPEGTIEERDAWGKKHLGITYKQAVAWINQAEIVEKIAGNITKIAPIDRPNYVESHFADGLYGVHNIEVVGNKNRVIFSAKGIARCSSVEKGSICFSDGIILTENNRILVHSSGIELTEFNRLNNKQKINDITEKIHDFNTGGRIQGIKKHELLIERYRLYLNNGDLNNAILDLKLAINLLYRPSLNKVEQADLKDNDKIELYKYWLAQSYYNSKQFDKSAFIVKDIIDNSFSKDMLNEEDLWLWAARMHAKFPKIANRELKKSLSQAIQKRDVCWISFAQFALGELDNESFIKQNEKHLPKNCKYINIQKIPLTYYYLAQKEIIKGNTKLGKQFLLKSLSDESLTKSSLEYGFAVHELAQFEK